MRHALVGLVVGICLSGGCGNDSPASRSTQQPTTAVPAGLLAGGEDFQQALTMPLGDGLNALRAGSEENPLLLLEIDPQHLEPVLLASPGDGMAAQEAFKAHELQVLVGSGFVSALHSLQPVGLLKVDGIALSNVENHGYTRILGINDQGMGVVHKEAYQRELFHSAIQVGPGIIEAGELDISERDLQRPKYFRSFVAVCDARWIAGVSLTPAHLYTLGQTLLEVFEAQGWQCAEVVNLAGDREAVLMLRTPTDIAFHGDPNTYKASLLGFRTITPSRG